MAANQHSMEDDIAYIRANLATKYLGHPDDDALYALDRLVEQYEQAKRDLAFVTVDRDNLVERETGLLEQYEGWVKLSHQLFNMIPREVWRDQGGDDGQGHYEGEYHAERIEQEIHAALASFPASARHWLTSMGVDEELVDEALTSNTDKSLE